MRLLGILVILTPAVYACWRVPVSLVAPMSDARTVLPPTGASLITRKLPTLKIEPSRGAGRC